MTPQEVRGDAIAAMALAYYPVPGQRVIDTPEWFQVITPSIKHGSLNGIERAVITRDVDAVIDRAISDYRSIGCKFRWTVPPGSRSGTSAAVGTSTVHRSSRRTGMCSLAATMAFFMR